jgi:hypothetical protein
VDTERVAARAEKIRLALTEEGLRTSSRRTVSMYALALIRYRRPLEEVLAHHEAHRAYLRGLKTQAC